MSMEALKRLNREAAIEAANRGIAERRLREARVQKGCKPWQRYSEAEIAWFDRMSAWSPLQVSVPKGSSPLGLELTAEAQWAFNCNRSTRGVMPKPKAKAAVKRQVKPSGDLEVKRLQREVARLQAELDRYRKSAMNSEFVVKLA